MDTDTTSRTLSRFAALCFYAGAACSVGRVQDALVLVLLGAAVALQAIALLVEAR